VGANAPPISLLLKKFSFLYQVEEGQIKKNWGDSEKKGVYVH